MLRRTHCGARLAAVLLLGLAAGCADLQDLPSAPPDAPTLYTGRYDPALSPEVRSTPVAVRPGRDYRFWYLIQNTSPDTRSYWVWGYEGSGTLELVGRSPDFTLAAGERRWVYVDMRVKLPAGVASSDVDLYFDAHDMQGDDYGYTRHILPVHVSTVLPSVAFVGDHYLERHYGQIQQRVYRGEIKNVRVRIENPLPAAHTLCAQWLDDEGRNGQTVRPSPHARCALVPADGATEVNFAYEVQGTASPGTLDRQTVQVYSLADPSAVVYGYLKTTTMGSPTALAYPGGPRLSRFHAVSFRASNFTNPYGIPIQVKSGEGLHVLQERQYLNWQGCDPNVFPYVQTRKAEAMDFAAANPGRLYIFVDEPRQGNGGCTTLTPRQYAQAYNDIVLAIRSKDPTARFSPGGFEQYLDHAPSSDTLHFTDYAQRFLEEYRDLYGEEPPLEEWRFHVYFEKSDPLDLARWQEKVDTAVAFSKRSGAPMVLAIGYPWQPDELDVRAGMEQMVGAVRARSWIRSAGWWSYDIPEGGNNRLTYFDGTNNDWTLTPEGEKYRSLIQ